jgi:hypothetical protein
MNRYRLLTRTAPLVLLLLTAALAKAQMPLARGSFTLPEEVRWGSATLEPGDYTFVIQNRAVAPETLQLRHDGKIVATLLALGHEDANFQNSSLLLQKVGDSYAVQKLRIGEVGVFTYAMPNAKRAHLAQAVPTAAIPVSSARNK